MLILTRVGDPRGTEKMMRKMNFPRRHHRPVDSQTGRQSYQSRLRRGRRVVATVNILMKLTEEIQPILDLVQDPDDTNAELVIVKMTAARRQGALLLAP